MDQQSRVVSYYKELIRFPLLPLLDSLRCNASHQTYAPSKLSSTRVNKVRWGTQISQRRILNKGLIRLLGERLIRAAQCPRKLVGESNAPVEKRNKGLMYIPIHAGLALPYRRARHSTIQYGVRKESAGELNYQMTRRLNKVLTVNSPCAQHT